MKKSESISLGTGGSSILSIFILVTLSMFGALAVSSASADLSFTRRAESTVADYYALDAQAQEYIALITEFQKSKSVASLNGDIFKIQGNDVSFELNSSSQSLSVTLSLFDYGYNITKYKIIPIINGEY